VDLDLDLDLADRADSSGWMAAVTGRSGATSAMGRITSSAASSVVMGR
jgi:hypothetical protein